VQILRTALIELTLTDRFGFGALVVSFSFGQHWFGFGYTSGVIGFGQYGTFGLVHTSGVILVWPVLVRFWCTSGVIGFGQHVRFGAHER
jgi:hypothetical protein